MADYPLPELGERTPLEVANKPNIDALSNRGVGGFLRTIPESMGAGSDVANLSILGYDPGSYYTGRGPLEAASMGGHLGSKEMAFRCNFITEREGKIFDYSAGHISNIDSQMLIDSLNAHFNVGRFYRGVSYRNLFVTKSIKGVETTPPHDVIGGGITDNLPKPSNNPRVSKLNEMIVQSKKFLEGHPVNQRRKKNGENPANMIWLWGQGVSPSLEPFQKRYGIRGAVISAVDLIKGIGIYAGMDIVDVQGATGLIDTNWRGKANSALKALETADLVYIHVEAIDEASHSGNVEMKVAAIEEFDKKLVGRIVEKIDFEYKIAILPDHYTPLSLKTHSKDPVPFIISSLDGEGDNLTTFSEKEIKKSGSLGIREGHKFMELFLKK